MSIKEVLEKIKGLWGKALEYEKDIWLGLLVITVGVGGFATGRLVDIEASKIPVRIETVELGRVGEEGTSKPSITIKTQKEGGVEVLGTTQVAAVAATSPVTGKVVGSKNGSKYHLPECSGAKRIKEENKIWFASVEEAKSAGYTAAANCPGL